MPDREKDVRLFERAADQRLRAAEFLLENGYNLDAVYLAGYAVECALKSLILKRTPKNQYSSMFERITHGRHAHDFEALGTILKQRPLNVVFPRDVGGMLRQVESWSTDLRYQVGLVKYNDARRFLNAAARFREWSERS